MNKIRQQDRKKMETITVIILVLAGLLIFAIAGYMWIKGQDETPSLQGEVVYRSQPQPIIINHTSTNLSLVPESAIERAKKTLHIAYGHTSHGSQITDGMTGLSQFSGCSLTTVRYTHGITVVLAERWTCVTVRFPVTWEIRTASHGRTGPART